MTRQSRVGVMPDNLMFIPSPEPRPRRPGVHPLMMELMRMLPPAHGPFPEKALWLEALPIITRLCYPTVEERERSHQAACRWRGLTIVRLEDPRDAG